MSLIYLKADGKFELISQKNGENMKKTATEKTFDITLTRASLEALRSLVITHRDEIGVKQSFDVVLEIERSIASTTRADRKRFVELLLKRALPEDLKEAYEICSRFANEGDPDAMVRLARMYRFGKHVNKDLDKAIEWMGSAASKNARRANIELIDMLIERASPEDLKEAYEICLKNVCECDMDTLKKLIVTNRLLKSNKAAKERRKKFVVFHLNHYASLSSLLLLRLTLHRDKEAILVTTGSYSKEKVLAKLLENGLFDDIILFDEKRWFMCESRELLINDMNTFFNKEFTLRDRDIHEAEEIYCSSDWSNSFAIFLAANSVKFTIFDIYKDQLSSEARYEAIYNSGSALEPYYTLQKKYGVLNGEKGNCKLKTRIESVYDSDDDSGNTKFDYNNFNEIKSEDRKKILNCFSINTQLLQGDVQLVLMNSRVFCRSHSIYSASEIPFMYQTLLDFFYIEGTRILIKQHPHDPINISKFFPYATILDPNFLVEFIKLYDEIHIANVTSIRTTSLDRIGGCVGNELTLGKVFFKIVQHLHHMYVCYDLAENLGGHFKIYHSVANDSPLAERNMMIQIVEKNFKKIHAERIVAERSETYPPNSFIIENDVKSVNLDKMGRGSVLVFTHEGDISEIMSKTEMKNVTPYRYKVQRSKDYSLAREDEKMLYVYTRDNKLKGKLEKFSFSKEFIYTGILVSCDRA